MNDYLVRMGITLSQPITEKHTRTFETAAYTGAVSSMQGWRVSMEDAHSVLLEVPGDETSSLFAIFDGHSGSKVAEFASQNLPNYILTKESYRLGDLKEAMKSAFLEMDSDMRDLEALQNDTSGSTAVLVLIKNGVLYCANLGDSRAIAVIDGNVHPLSKDHKPNLPSEYERIFRAGGFVDCNRVNGNLAVSRAFGDYMYKMNERQDQDKQAVIALPDVTESKMNDKWDFVLLACDGIWDVLSNSEAGDFVYSAIQEGKSPDVICEDLLNRCLSPVSNNGGAGCDNMTVILVVFKNPARKCELYLRKRANPLCNKS